MRTTTRAGNHPPRSPTGRAVAVITNRPLVWRELRRCLQPTLGQKLAGPFPTNARSPTARRPLTRTAQYCSRQDQPLCARCRGAACQYWRPEAGLVILDCDRDQNAALDLCRRLGFRVPGSRLILITDRATGVFLSRALEAGACVILTRPLAAPEVRWAISVAASGGIYMPCALAELVRIPPHTIETLETLSPSPVSLTSRERELLEFQAQGLAYKQIAGRLHLSENTVRNHLLSARQKLGAHSGIEAINQAFGRGQPG